MKGTPRHADLYRPRKNAVPESSPALGAGHRQANRQYIDRTEEHARAYAEALYDVSAITETERLTLLDDAREAAEARVREFRAAEQA